MTYYEGVSFASSFRASLSILSVISVAKNPDRAYRPGSARPLDLEDGSASSFLLKRIRDEVHRFAVTYHRKLRSRRMAESALEKIKGVSTARRMALLRRFGSVEGVRGASTEDIASVKGIGSGLAGEIKKALQKPDGRG